jgi:hypothetical protein
MVAAFDPTSGISHPRRRTGRRSGLARGIARPAQCFAAGFCRLRSSKRTRPTVTGPSPCASRQKTLWSASEPRKPILLKDACGCPTG